MGGTVPQSPVRSAGAIAAVPLAGAPMNGVMHTFRDTTYTKVFVGGLAWETQRDTMRRHFEQYGEIVEAVVIMDKNTGRSKGYGFVTFGDAEGARKACMDATPVIDGRRANCNLASLGAHRSRPATPVLRGNRSHGGMLPYSPSTHGGGGPTFTGSPAYPHQPYYPNYQVYGYSPYSQDYGYQQGVYNPYGYAQYPAQMYGGAMGGAAVYNPYGNMHFMQPMQGATGGSHGGTGGAAAFPLPTSSPGDSSNSSGSSGYPGGNSGVPALANLPPFGITAHPNTGSGAFSAQQFAAPPLLSSANVTTTMAIGSSTPLFVVPPPSKQQHLATPSKIAEQPSA